MKKSPSSTLASPVRGASLLTKTRVSVAIGAALALAVVAGGCKSSSSPSRTEVAPPMSASGVVTDSTGAVLSGVTVAAGSEKIKTGSDGTYSLSVHSGTQVISFTKTGYLESSKQVLPVTGTTANVSAALMAMAAPKPLDATKGGTVAGVRGSTLKAGAGVFVDSKGKAVKGSVDVSLTPLNPSMHGELAAYPGTLTGSTNGGKPALLTTYGVLDVTVMQNGEKLQVAAGKKVSVEIPVAKADNMPATEDLWSFNPTTGIWDHEGTATLHGSTYAADLPHFSYYNIDGQIHENEATCVTGLVVDKAGNPVSGADVSPIQGASEDMLIQTDSTGHYCTWLISGASETITANSTSSPYGEGTVSVTGGAVVDFPGSYVCSNLNCTSAPNIVLDQPPCKKDSDCASDLTCCAVNGQNMCLESFACTEAMSGGLFGDAGGTACKSMSDCSNGDTCCAIPSSGSSLCLPAATCSLLGQGSGCTANTGTVTAKINGQSIDWNCFIAESVAGTGDAGMAGEVIITATSTGTNAETFEILLESTDDFKGFASGKTLTIDEDGGSGVAVVVSGTEPNGAMFEGEVVSGSLTLSQWSIASGGTIAFSFSSDTKLSADVTGDGGTSVVNGTLSGMGSATVTALP